jgi:ubiquinone/menaquinone biosynthesis C-methylase UbiE
LAGFGEEGTNKEMKYWQSNKAKLHGDASLEAYDSFAQQVVELMQPKLSEVILDVGCGDGEITRRIAEKSGATLVGMDFSGRFLSIAIQNYPLMCWVHGDALARWKFEDGFFDKIFSSQFLQYVSPSKVWFILDETKRVLKLGGKAYYFNVPDKTKFFNYFNTPRKLLVHGLSSFMTGKIFPKDGSYWHNIKSIAKTAIMLNLECTLLPSFIASDYRSHMVLEKKGNHEIS